MDCSTLPLAIRQKNSYVEQLTMSILFPARSNPVGAKYFEVNDDELFGDSTRKDNGEQMFLWRQDREESMSDWTVILNEDQTFYCHKVYLAKGPRSCEYFSGLFRKAVTLSEEQDDTSRIALSSEDAKAFPVMLDFIYSSNGLLSVNSGNVISLRSLAQYFLCRELMTKANTFIQHDLSKDTAVGYLRAASERNDMKVQESARKLIVENYSDMNADELVALPVDLLRSIVCSKDLNPKCLADVGRDIKRFFETNPNELNARLLNEMTNNLPVTAISCDTAVGFRNLISQLDKQKEDQESWIALNTLCKLCAHSLASKWEGLNIETCMEEFTNPRIDGDFHGGGRLSVMLLGEALRQAKIDHEEAITKLHHEKQTTSMLEKQRNTLEKENAALQRQVLEQKERLSRRDKTIAENVARLSKQEKTIADQKSHLEKRGDTIYEHEKTITDQKSRLLKRRDTINEQREQLAKLETENRQIYGPREQRRYSHQRYPYNN